MAFPTIQFKATNIQLDDAQARLLEEKFQSLGKFIDDNETDVRCEVEFEKETAQQSGPVHRVEANLTVAGKLYRAESSEMSFEKAIDEVRAELDKELRRANDKRETMIKRGGRRIKEMLRFGR